MYEGVIEHLAIPVDDIEREGQTAHHVFQRYDGIVQLVVVGIEQHGLHLGLVVKVAAEQVEILGKQTRCHA